MSEDVIKHEPTAMEIVQQIAASPNAKDQVEVMKELIKMKEHQEDREARRVFSQALQQMQASIAPITRDGEIIVKGIVRSRYATMDQLDDVLRPLMKEYGFSFQMSEVGIEEGMRVFTGTLMHSNGQDQTLMVRLPLDKSDFRSVVQSEAATISYARRQLYKLHFNIVERNEPSGGESVEAIDEEQLKDLETLMNDVNANRKSFCHYFQIEKVADLKKSDLLLATEMLRQKKR